MNRPSFWSLALVDIPNPHFADVSIAAWPPTATTDPAEWATTLFSLESTPKWVMGATGLRQLLVPLIGVPVAPRNVFTVWEVQGDEALLGYDDRHLDFRVGVGVDPGNRLVRVVTAVRLKGWRGRLYFLPVAIAHPVVVRSMLKRARRVLTRAKPR